MGKYLFTESQVKYVVDALLKEQTDMQTTVMAVQCFLNQVMNAKLVIDGKSGPNSLTEKALKAFQKKKSDQGFRIDIDGVWGYYTQDTLTPQENQIWKKCRNKYERL